MTKQLTKHLALIVVLTALVVLGILYPFLAVEYDILAMPLSTIVQSFGVLGLLLVPIGLPWLWHEIVKHSQRKRNLTYKNRGYSFALAAVIASSVVTVLVLLVVFLAFSRIFGLLLFSIWLYAVLKILLPKIRLLKTTEAEYFNFTPLYLLCLPILTLLLQLALAAHAKEWSRNRAIANASEFISGIERYRAQYGQYPVSLLAQWKDYYPDVVGVEKYHYSPHGDSYNLFFENPRFLLDKIGTREWIVYNPRDEHRIYSHASGFLLLSPEVLERSQGWYASHDTLHAHWKYFLFD